MTDILSSPCRVNDRSRTVYYFDGYVSVEVISGTEEQQKATLALVGQAQAAIRALMASGCVMREGERWHTHMCWEYGDGKACAPGCAESYAVLREAGVTSDAATTMHGPK